MNFIYKIKNFQRVVDDRDKVIDEFTDYKTKTDKLIEALAEDKFKQLQEISSLKDMLIDKKDLEIKKINGAKGGLQKENNKLSNELEESKKVQKSLEEQLADYKNNKWLVRELTPEKARTQKIKPVKPVKRSVTKYMAEKHDY